MNRSPTAAALLSLGSSPSGGFHTQSSSGEFRDSGYQPSPRISARCKRATLSTDWKTTAPGTMAPLDLAARKQAEPSPWEWPCRPAQYRGGAGPAGRDPGQQRGALPGQRFSRAAALLRTGPPADSTIRPQLDPHRKARLAGDVEDLLPAEVDIAGLTVAQYLARLAAEATTIINAVDYGRTVYDLAIRRDLIKIGEDMVNVAFDAPVDFAPREQIEDAEKRLYDLAEIGRYGGGFQKFEARSPPPSTWRRAPTSATASSGLATGLRDLDTKMGGLQLRPDHRRRPSRHGQDRARHQHRLQRGAGWRGEVRRRPYRHGQRRHRRFLLARNVGRAARHPHHRRAEQHPVEHHPARRHHRKRTSRRSRTSRSSCSTCRSSSTRPAG